jgi:hypothetical protein
MNRRQRRAKLFPKIPPACQCDRATEGMYRVYELPPSLVDTLVDDSPIDGHWENIRRCSACGQYWHQSTICGHANVETFEKISMERREQLVGVKS